MDKKIKVGIVGCGNISGIYFDRLCKIFKNVEVAACADLDIERAKAKQAEYPSVKVCSAAELLADPQIDIVVNLTIPNAHAEVALSAVSAGKSVYNEKPLTITRQDAAKLLSLAKEKKVRVGGAPDTFLGGGLQTCRKLIDDGWIGKPVAGTAFMMCHGHESWHPSPEFYYQVGGGPMFDMGPYYLTALVSLLGPVARVSGMTRATFPERLITSQPKCGTRVKVEVPTHVAGLLEFASGAIITIITSFDVWGQSVPPIQIFGETGSLTVPDPNGFGGPVTLLRQNCKTWQEIPLAFGYAENSRGLGVADMAAAISSNRPHRASGELCYHVLDVMHLIHDAASSGKTLKVESTCQRPSAMPLGLVDGQIDV